MRFLSRDRLDHAPGEWTGLDAMLQLTKTAALLMDWLSWSDRPRK